MGKICFASFAGHSALLLLLLTNARAVIIESWKNTSTLVGPPIATTRSRITSTLTVSPVPTSTFHNISALTVPPDPIPIRSSQTLVSSDPATATVSTLPIACRQGDTTLVSSPMFTLITDSVEVPFPQPPATATSAVESSTPTPAEQCHLFINQQFDEIARHQTIYMSAYIELFNAHGAAQGTNDTIEYSYIGIRPGWSGVFVLNPDGYMQISLRKARKSEVRNGGEEWTDWVWDFGVRRSDSELRWSSSNQGGNEGLPGCWVQKWTDSRIDTSHGRGMRNIDCFWDC